MENIDWEKLGFGYIKTDYNIRCHYKNGAWSDLEVSDSEYFTMHIAATAIHYGQESFHSVQHGTPGLKILGIISQFLKVPQDRWIFIIRAGIPIFIIRHMILGSTLKSLRER